jgi:hypothetical protein
VRDRAEEVEEEVMAAEVMVVVVMSRWGGWSA